MTTLRPNRSGPTWRAEASQVLDPEQTFVFCCCGVAMQFHWPRGRETVHCYGCGARFERPEHFPERSPLIWEPPPAPQPRWRAWLRRRVHARHLIVLALSLLALGFLTTGIMLLSRSR